MKKPYLFIALFSFLFSLSSLSALGKKDAGEEKYQNSEWILCITEFDYSLLPPANRLAGDVLTRDLVNKLKSINYRLRISPEYAYYEGYVWQQEINTAAKAISTKQNERSQLLYRGDPNWKYRSNLKKIDADLVKLQETLAEKEAQRPLIEREPAFNLIQANLNGTYPAPPKEGGERRFCQSQKIDGFLTGAIREFHNRYYIHLKLFTLYTNSWVYEDDIIFSMDDADGAVEEITARLSAVLAGNKPASIAVTVDPPEAQVLINQSYAGRGTIPERERPPGKVTIAATAEGYTPITVETELAPAESTDIAISLSPLHYTDVTINAPGHNGASIYHGALYVGEAPLILSLPIGSLEYVSVESRREMGKGVFTTPNLPVDSFNVSIKMKIPPPSGQRRVNRARSWYYWAWGGTWVTGIAAWITYGMYSSRNAALNQSNSSDFRDSTARFGIVSTGAIIVVGAAIGYEIFQMARYMYTATSGVTPIIKEDKNKR